MRYEARFLEDTFVRRWVVYRDGKKRYDAGYPMKGNENVIIAETEPEAKIMAFALNNPGLMKFIMDAVADGDMLARDWGKDSEVADLTKMEYFTGVVVAP